ncbi:hypothetical protein OCK74_05025 [Chitinophagaceae bacterium LB-8]|uniref:Uncharacterized protein n=1 Tax=Paraflavisolibacter caeni TaxID=2982496 RepID=A0A9X3B6T5_9BACT|nr:hypothetical protein [Paraflavisolibacter caeni]MCU7548465.1 hypothetical protein [Paraflavisolibacter caeni]
MNYVLVMLLLLLQLAGYAQKDSITLYAYEQKVIPGIAPARDVEEGGTVVRKATEPEVQYYIFIAVPPGITRHPTSLWIKGKQFGVKAKETATPVERLITNDSVIILVPRIEGKVLQLIPVQTSPTQNQEGAELAKQNELVVVYQANGRIHYQAQERITTLDPVQLQ